jgi:hypothetical protein
LQHGIAGDNEEGFFEGKNAVLVFSGAEPAGDIVALGFSQSRDLECGRRALRAVLAFQFLQQSIFVDLGDVHEGSDAGIAQRVQACGGLGSEKEAHTR